MAAYNIKRRRPGFEQLNDFRIRIAAAGGTSFRGATLTGAVFEGADLRGAAFRSLSGAVLRGCKNLPLAWVEEDRWRDPLLQALLVTGQGESVKLAGRNLSGANLDAAILRGADLSHCDLTGASFRGADLTNAILSEVQALGTDFTGATLTGACLRDWHIDPDTRLDDVQCSYFYLRDTEDAQGFRDRRPHDGVFNPGDFHDLFQRVRDTIELIIGNKGDRSSWMRAFQRVTEEYPEVTPDAVLSFQRAGDKCIITIAAPPGIDKEGVAQTFDRSYHTALAEPVMRALPPEANAMVPVRPPGPVASGVKAKVFVSYSHDDEKLKHRLIQHLESLKHERLVDVWHEGEIRLGSEREATILENLREADVILLLVSASFIASPFCYHRDLETAIERHAARTARVIPIIVRECEWRGLPFGRLQAARDGKAITSPANHRAWTETVREIRRAIVDLRQCEVAS